MPTPWRLRAPGHRIPSRDSKLSNTPNGNAVVIRPTFHAEETEMSAGAFSSATSFFLRGSAYGKPDLLLAIMHARLYTDSCRLFPQFKNRSRNNVTRHS